MKLFFPHPEAEFLHTGVGRDVFNLQKRPEPQIMADVARGEYEFIIAGNSRHPGFNPRRNFFNNLANVTGKFLRQPKLLKGRFPYEKAASRLIGLDCECCPVIDNQRFRELDLCICFFKRDLPQNPCNAFLYTHAKTENSGNILSTPPFSRWVEKLRPISLGIHDDLAARLSRLDPPKKTDVFFAGELSGRPNRLSGIHQLERLKAEGFRIDIASERLSADEFFRRCAQACLVWSPEGFGWDCYRHYEVCAAGSVPILQSPPIQCHAPFTDDENALFYFVEGDHLAARIRRALQNRQRLLEMGRDARQHVLLRHTHKALSRHIIEETRRTLAEQSAAN